METKDVYKKIARPDVCICTFTVRYVPKKHLMKVQHPRESVRKKAIKDHVKEFTMKNYPITLDANNKFPTKKTEERVLRSIWRSRLKKDKFEDFVMFIRNIDVKHRSKVNYDFSYQEH